MTAIKGNSYHGNYLGEVTPWYSATAFIAYTVNEV